MAKGFNPYVLHALRIPLALLKYDGATQTRKSLSWGGKALYGRLALFLGRPKAKAESFCNPSLKTMAAAMKTSGDTVGRWLAELVDHGFIERIRNGRGPAECVFLAHPCLSSEALLKMIQTPQFRGIRGALPPPQTRGIKAKAQPRNLTSPIPQLCAFNSATLRFPTPQLCGLPYKEENVHENVQENVQRQHHRWDAADHDGGGDDDVDATVENHSSKTKLSSAFARSVEAAAGWQLSPRQSARECMSGAHASW